MKNLKRGDEMGVYEDPPIFWAPKLKRHTGKKESQKCAYCVKTRKLSRKKEGEKH